MGAWVDYKKSAVAILKPEGYKELQGNITVEEAPQSKSDKVYTIKPTDPEDVDISSGAIYRFLFAEYRFLYSVRSNAEFDEKYDEFLRVVALLPNATTINASPTFEMDETNEFAIGELSLQATSSDC